MKNKDHFKKKNNEVGREVALQISKYSNIQPQEWKYRILGRKQTLEPNREPNTNLFTYKKAEYDLGSSTDE